MCTSENVKKTKQIAKKYRIAKANKKIIGRYNLKDITGIDDIDDEDKVIKEFENTVEKLSLYPDYGEDMKNIFKRLYVSKEKIIRKRTCRYV